MAAKQKPFTMISNGFIMCKGLTAYQKMTFIALNKFKDKNNKCHPSMETLAGAVGCSARTIIKTVKVLTDLQLIDKAKMPGSNVNKYTILSDGEFLSYKNEADTLSGETNSSVLVNDVQPIGEAVADKQEPYNNNHFNKNHLSINRDDEIDEMGAYRDLIKEQIEYDIMCERYERERVDEVVELMLDVVCGKQETIKIGGVEYPSEAVKSRFLKLSAEHIEYVFDSVDRNPSKIRNIRAYMRSVLYNAPTTIDSYYRAEVNHDMNGGGG